jgi:RNA recognition motif. (a.k.a. RRM, RBD, or RNP domain)
MAIYIGNLSYEVTQDELTQTFAEYGKVKRVQLPTDRETGRLRGFAFVELETDREESAAIEALDGSEWMGRDLKVNKLRPGKQATVVRGFDSEPVFMGDGVPRIKHPDYKKRTPNSRRVRPSKQRSASVNPPRIFNQKSSEKEGMKIVLKGNLDDTSSADLEIILNHLRRISGDSSIKIFRVEEGSIILKLSGTEEGFKILQNLFQTGQLTELGGLNIESVDLETLSSDIRNDDLVFSKSTLAIEKTDFIDRINSEVIPSIVYSRCVVNQTASSESINQIGIQGVDMSENYVNNLQGSNIANMSNTLKDNARQQANQHNHSSEQDKTLAEAASEIQNLLKQLEQNEPKATDMQKVTYINDETTPNFKRRVVSALKAGGETAIEEFLDNPYIKCWKSSC